MAANLGGTTPVLDPGEEVKGRMAAVSATITRPSNTTAYAAKDAIADKTSSATILTFSSVARANGKGGYIVGIRIMTNQIANVAQYKLHLFKNAPTVISDNVAMTAPLFSDASDYLGSITLIAVVSEDGSAGAAYTQQDTTLEPPLSIAYLCDTDDVNIYGMLETLTVFTPASGQKFDIRLTCELN